MIKENLFLSVFTTNLLLFSLNSFADCEELIKAARDGDADAVITELNSGVSVKCLGRLGMNALEWAVNKNNIGVVRILIDRGADVNYTNKNGWTPLHRAVYHRHCPIIKELIASGASLRATSSYGITPRSMAVGNSFSDVFDLAVEEGLRIRAIRDEIRSLDDGIFLRYCYGLCQADWESQE